MYWTNFYDIIIFLRKAMKKSVVYTIIIFTILHSGFCRKTGEQKNAPIKVAVSVFPLFDITRNICGDKAEVFFTIPAGADPHTYEPKPSIARDLQKAAIFIGVEREFDGWMESYLRPDTARKYLMPAAANPHIWLSPREAITIAGKVTQYLVEIDKDHSDYYRKNLEAYTEKLNSLDKFISSLFVVKFNKSFIQWHESWNYFAADYGLTISGTVQREGSDKSSVRSLKEIIERARHDKVTVIAVSLNSENKNAEIMAGEIKGSIVRLDEIGDPNTPGRSNYLELMRFNAKNLAEALR
jgi:zinc transport system substrate-binding protein